MVTGESFQKKKGIGGGGLANNIYRGENTQGITGACELTDVKAL